MTLSPVPGCLVRCPDEMPGIVARCWPPGEPTHAEVRLPDGGTRRHAIAELRSGQMAGREVWIQGAGSGPPPGFGKVQATRIAGRARPGPRAVRVERRDPKWLPFQMLRDVMPIGARMRRGMVGAHADHAERVRLRTLGQALSSWAANTGAFGALDLDPLPHQTRLAHRVVSSGTKGWLIADDVGLGKTIEIGLILNALAQRGQCRRVLVICPSSLTRQWQGEMRHRFSRGIRDLRTRFRTGPPRPAAAAGPSPDLDGPRQAGEPSLDARPGRPSGTSSLSTRHIGSACPRPASARPAMRWPRR